ncbi:phosphatase family protein [Aspergillus egyptiacus]|nr:phosphatase family protein [Aspergillus egyptiacus]
MASNNEQPWVGQHPDHDSLGPDSTDSSPSLVNAVKARKAEYTRHRSVHVKVGTWNVAAIAGTEKDIGNWFVQRKGVCEHVLGSQDSKPGVPNSEDAASLLEVAPDQVGLYVLGLQEIVDVSSPAEALRPYVDPAPANRWKAAVEAALPQGYKLVAEIQLIGLLQLIYAAPFIADSVSEVSCTSVGTGLLGYMGNKGAVATRLILGETTCLIFVNCHMAAGSDKASLERRNWDASQILTRTRFDSIDPDHTLRNEPSDVIGDEDFAFWFGDLNYRLEDIPGDDVRQVLSRHTVNEYDKRRRSLVEMNDKSSSPHVFVIDDAEDSSELPSRTQSFELEDDLDPHQDPASLQTTISSLFPHDQLRMQQKLRKAFHDGWHEGPISFLPTYKYDVGSVARFDSSEKNRGPSWCDRILYRSRKDKLRYERLVKEAAEARKRDEEMKARGLENAVADDSVLFDYDPDADGADSDEYDPNEDASVATTPPHATEESDDSIRLDYYLSHQGIRSSDHKPLVAGFTIELECVDPKLKAQVHQEVVRKLDKVENESRPGLTVVVDHHGPEPSDHASETDPNAVDFGDIIFDVPVSRTLSVANTGGVSATFTVQKPERGADYGTPWIEYSVEKPHHDEPNDQNKKSPPNECTLLPGELAIVDITVWVRDDARLLRRLNNGELKLEEVLVLRVKSGRDHFVSAYGKWLPTAFGRSLEELTRIPEAGARSLANSSKESEESGVLISAPRELFKLTEAISELTERAVAEWDMVGGEKEHIPPWEREPHGFAWPFEPESWTLKDKEERSHLLALAREALDTNKAFSDVFAPEVSSLHRLEILSETLVAFLRFLQDGVIPAAVWQNLDQQIQVRERTKQQLSWEDSQAWVLESLSHSPAHSISFTFVTFLLTRIANEIAPVPSIPPHDPEAAANVNTEEKTRRRQAVERALSGLFSSVLVSADVPSPSKDRERRALEERKRSIIEPFLKAIGVDSHGPSGGVP